MPMLRRLAGTNVPADASNTARPSITAEVSVCPWLSREPVAGRQAEPVSLM